MEEILKKLKILSDAAKYDVSCSSSGVGRANSGRIGNAAAMGICHTWSADGRCISLLKILFTNKCVYDCQYCINRRSSDVQRASLEPEELAKLTIEFYRRNYIEGLFLSSAVEVSPDYTAEKILKALRLIRYEHGFAGYIHAKIIPGVSPEILHEIGLVADRLSINTELPTRESLSLLAPEKKPEDMINSMTQIRDTILDRGITKLSNVGSVIGVGCDVLDAPTQYNELKNNYSDKNSFQSINSNSLSMMKGRKSAKVFAPAGQTTQMIIGATGETDRLIVKASEKLYQGYNLKRVYFSAYIPVGNTKNSSLPDVLTPPPLKREHRLYQADWLLRFYNFTADEILDENTPFLDPDLDPKISWALRHLDHFPMEVNKVSKEELMRIPGIGEISAMRIVRQRRLCAVKFDDLKKLGVVVKRAKYFLLCCGRYNGNIDIDPNKIKSNLLDVAACSGRPLLEINNIRNNLLEAPKNMQLSMQSIL